MKSVTVFISCYLLVRLFCVRYLLLIPCIWRIQSLRPLWLNTMWFDSETVTGIIQQRRWPLGQRVKGYYNYLLSPWGLFSNKCQKCKAATHYGIRRPFSFWDARVRPSSLQVPLHTLEINMKQNKIRSVITNIGYITNRTILVQHDLKLLLLLFFTDDCTSCSSFIM